MNDAVAGLAHVNIRAPQALIEDVRAFYRDVIGLREGPRPPFRSRGYWLYAGGRDVLHLTVDPGAERASGDGWLDHVAFAATGAALCPNAFDHVESAPWDAITGIAPWYRDCTAAPDAIFYDGFDGAVPWSMARSGADAPS